MKKFIKFCTMAVLVIVTIGFLLSAAGSFDGRKLLDDVKEGGDALLEDVKEGGSALLDDVLKGYEGLEGYDINDATVFDKDEPVESGNIDRVFENISASVLDVEIGGCMLEILASEDGNVRVVADSVKKIQAYQKGDELRIKSAGKAIEDTEGSKIRLYLPAGYRWQKVDMEVGAGQIMAEGLLVSKLEVSVGAGEIRLNEMEIEELEAQVGMGNFIAKGTVSVSIEAECSMGNMELELSGDQTDYDYEVECVAGNIKIGEDKYGGGIVKEQKIDNGAGRRMDLECSIGNIAVTFEAGINIFQTEHHHIPECLLLLCL